jgi:lysozyme
MIDMKLSRKGLAAIASMEAVSLTAYYDSVGVLTVGIGVTKSDKIDPKDFLNNKKLTLEEAFAQYKEVIKKYETSVNKFLKHEIAQHEYDALVSFQYNTGGLAGSTLGRLVNMGVHGEQIVKAFRMWTKGTVGGKKLVIKGLVNRRNMEINMFMNAEYPKPEMLLYHPDSRGRYKMSEATVINPLEWINE